MGARSTVRERQVRPLCQLGKSNATLPKDQSFRLMSRSSEALELIAARQRLRQGKTKGPRKKRPKPRPNAKAAAQNQLQPRNPSARRRRTEFGTPPRKPGTQQSKVQQGVTVPVRNIAPGFPARRQCPDKETILRSLAKTRTVRPKRDMPGLWVERRYRAEFERPASRNSKNEGLLEA